MFRSNQGSVIPSNLKVGRPGKGWTAQTRTNSPSVQPPNLVQPFPPRTHRRRRAGAHMHARSRVCGYAYRLDKVRRLDGFRQGAASSRPTLRLTPANTQEVGR